MMSGSEEDLNNMDMWPNSNDIHGLGSSLISSCDSRNRKDDDSWEVIPNNQVDRGGDTGDSLVLVEDDNHQSGAIKKNRNPRTLRHSASSPDLTSSYCRYPTEGDEYEKQDCAKHSFYDENDDDENTNNNVMSVDLSSYDAEDDTSSHVVVSSPEEPVLVDTTVDHNDSFDDHVMISSSLSPVRRVQSFRDAILLPETPPSKSKQQLLLLQAEQYRRRQQQQQKTAKTKPKFVVVETNSLMQKRSLSTGDLQALAKINEHEENFGDNLDADAMEYYYQKARGYAGRKNALKLRPDEMKRKEMSLVKKDLQRKQN